MGCIATKDQTAFNSIIKSHPTTILTPADKQLAIKFRILDSIKRRDIILFEKTIQEYEPKSLEVLGPLAQQKTILHHIAEHNFHEGMAMALEYIAQAFPADIQKLLNCKDSAGNTPLITCCLYDSVETLEVLVKYEQFLDPAAKNLTRKTALEIATEKDSPCVNILNSTVSFQSKATTGSVTGSTYLTPKEEVHTKRKRSRMNSIYLKSIASTTNIDIQTSRLFQIMRNIEENKEGNFVDDEFPHDMLSMMDSALIPEMTDKYDALKWERPSQFFKNTNPDSIKIFRGVELNEVAKSPLAGCDLYSVLAAMVEFPQRLLKIFTTKEINTQGVYSVNFTVSGIPIEIVLDDYFPCVQNSKLLYSTPNQSELWFLLLEKAFAKLYGNYTEIQRVHVLEAFETLTGMPSLQKPLLNAEENDLWETLRENDKKNFIICAGSYERKGQKNRIFPIVGLFEQQNIRMIKLRNPFEDFNWKGNLSDGSSKWTKELREEVGHYQGERNAVYMEIQEFIANFDFISICHYNDNWVSTNLEVMAKANEAVFFEFDLEKDTEVFLSVHQKLPRFLPEAGGYGISPLEIVLAEDIDEKETQAIAFGEKDALVGKQTVYVAEKGKVKLSAGRYFLRVKMRWIDGEAHEFSLNAFAPIPLRIKQVEKKDHVNFMNQILMNCAENTKEKFKFSNKCQFSSAWAGPYMWLCAVNNGKKVWELTITLDKMENLKINKKYKKYENTLVLVVKPKERVVTYIRRVNGGAAVLAWNFKHEWK